LQRVVERLRKIIEGETKEKKKAFEGTPRKPFE